MTEPREHDWFRPDFIAYDCCRACGIVRRADGKNKPCRGEVKVTLRDKPARPDIPQWRAIQVLFPVPVALPDRWQQRLDQLVGEVCAAYEAAHPDRIMWPAGVGQRITYMPMTREEEQERGLEFDETTFAIDVAERERYEGERLEPRVPEREKIAVRWAKVGYLLGELYDGDEARLWMGLANRALDGRRPRECDPEEVTDLLMQLLDGAYT